MIYPGLSYITTLLYHLIYHNLAFWSSLQTQNEISDLIFGCILSFLSNKWPRVVLDGKSSQDYPGNARVPGRFILGPSFYTLMTFLTISYADKIILYADQASNLWQQLKLVSDLEFDLDLA